MKKLSYKQPSALSERDMWPWQYSEQLWSGRDPLTLGFLAPPRDGSLTPLEPRLLAAGHEKSLHKAPQALLFGENFQVACPLSL